MIGFMFVFEVLVVGVQIDRTAKVNLFAVEWCKTKVSLKASGSIKFPDGLLTELKII